MLIRSEEVCNQPRELKAPSSFKALKQKPLILACAFLGQVYGFCLGATPPHAILGVRCCKTSKTLLPQSGY